jgi:hypothetical protein
VEFAVTLHKVEGLQLAPLGPDLYAAYGVDGDDEAAFRAEVAQNMERELKNAVDARVKQQVMDKLDRHLRGPRHSGGTGEARKSMVFASRCSSSSAAPAPRIST